MMERTDRPVSDKIKGDIILKWFYKSPYAVGLITDSVIDSRLRKERFVKSSEVAIDGMVRVLDNLCQLGYLDYELRKSEITSGDAKCYNITTAGIEYIQSVIDDEILNGIQNKNNNGTHDIIYMLDKTLEWFCMTVDTVENKHKTFPRKSVTKYDSGIRIIEQYPEMNTYRFSSQYDEILDKLILDKYINVIGDTRKLYSINIEGQLFNEKGGYRGRIRRESNKQKWQNTERIVLAVGTSLAGVAGIWVLLKDEATRNILVSFGLSSLGAWICITILSLMKKK